MRAIYAFETIETLQFASHRLCGRVKIRFIARVKEGGRLALLGSNTGSMWASRPPWQQHRYNVSESPSVAATQDQCGRVALRCSNTGSMWATRPPLQQHRINVSESPSVAVTQVQCARVALLASNTVSMWASRPHSYCGQWLKQAPHQ